MRKIVQCLFLAVVISGMLGGTMTQPSDLIKDGRKIIPGNYLKAWQVCYSAFVQIPDLTEQERELENYEIEFSEEKDNYVVEFIPQLLSEEKAKLFNRMVIGRNTKYWVSKIDLRIIKRVFYKS